MKQGKLSTNFTSQRLDNTLCHSVDNCPYCKYCNCSAHWLFLKNLLKRTVVVLIFYIMSSNQEILNSVYFDRAGYGSKAIALRDAKKIWNKNV